jgi:tetratricopeptide (TPR) repeat protein
MASRKRVTPQDASRFDFGGAALRRGWPRLHAGDLEPWPGGRGAAALQAAWRAFHEGRFPEAIEAGAACGTGGAAVANKAAGVHATYSAASPAEATRILRAAIARGEAAVARQPECANAHYFLAFVLGRYGQRISVAKALADGLGGRVHAALQRTLALEPDHAEAQVALGVFHAEVVDKVGALAARLGYGASREAALAAFERARALSPQSPVACLEYARALRRLDPTAAVRARALLEAAVAMEPADAMEALDVNAARAELLDA